MNSKQLFKSIKGLLRNAASMVVACFVMFSLIYCSNTIVYDNYSEVVTSALQRSNENDVVCVVSPKDKMTNFTSLYRRVTSEVRYQTDTVGSIEIGYFVNNNFGFSPCEIQLSNSYSLTPNLFSCYGDNFSEYNYGIHFMFDLSEENSLNDLIVSVSLADKIIESSFDISSYDDLIGQKVKIKLYYASGSDFTQYFNIANVATGSENPNIDNMLKSDIVYCPFGDVFQYRLTYASLFVLMKTNEYTANKYVLNKMRIYFGASLFSYDFYKINQNGDFSILNVDTLINRAENFYGKVGVKANGLIVFMVSTALLIAIVIASYYFFFKEKVSSLRKQDVYFSLIFSYFLSFLLFFIITKIFANVLFVCFVSSYSVVASTILIILCMLLYANIISGNNSSVIRKNNNDKYYEIEI